MRDLKYLVAYILPLLPTLGFWFGGAMAYLTPLVIFIVFPLMELFLPGTEENHSPNTEKSRFENRFFDVLLYLNVPIMYVLLATYFSLLTSANWPTWEWVGHTLSLGMVCGAIGINVAHELGHRTKKYEQYLAQALLLSSCYLHFFVEHNRGHHKHVATPLDPATARLGESVYAFWIRSVFGGWRSAWRLEQERLERNKLPFISWHNVMVRLTLLQLAALAVVGIIWGPFAVACYLLMGLIGGLMLETVNYLEHYGIVRDEIRPGVYEPVKPWHSWNSNHSLGRILLYELTRHSDHHYRASRKYQILRYHKESPQLPTGYPGMMVLSLFPPAWFHIMHKQLERTQVDHA
ncbi:MAG: alkane 1-monooxygenase [Bacteroidota bacterium]